LKIPLFDGLRTPSRHEQAELKGERIAQEKKHFENALRLEIQKLVLDFQEYLKLKAVIDRQVAEAGRALKLAKERYLSKSGLTTELDQAQ